MSLLFQFTATAENDEFQLRLEKALQHLQVTRESPLSVYLNGLLLGLPEQVSAEITHPIRQRVRPANEVPLSHIAFWAQHGRGPIVESAPYQLRGSADTPPVFVQPDALVASGLYRSTVKYYLNDLGPVEVLADDHFVVSFKKCVPGCTYYVYGPEQQVVGAQANRYTEYAPGLILATDRERKLSAMGKQAIILPNRPDIIERIVLEILDETGRGSDKELHMPELVDVQTDVNPFTVILNYKAPNVFDRSTLLASSEDADLLLVMFSGMVSSIQIDTVLGKELQYTIISTADRL